MASLQIHLDLAWFSGWKSSPFYRKIEMLFLFSHISLDIHVSLYTKSCICNNVMLQIQVQANKVDLELGHLHDLPDHWGNAPYMVARVSLDSVAFGDHSLASGHWHGCNS